MLRISLVIAKFCLGTITLLAIFLQFRADAILENFTPVNFFSYFTVQSNILAAIALIISAVFLFNNKNSRFLDFFRGAVLVYMIITAIVYHVLLSDTGTTEATINWVNNLLHYILPTALVIDWLLDPPRKKLNYTEIFLWFIFPIIYILYSLVRGALTGWYPYDFLNPATNGILGIVQYILIIGAGVVTLSLITTWISRKRLANL